MTYRIFGSELSPYSVKVRSYFRFKGLPHDWIPRSPAVQAEFQKYAKLPLVVTPDGEGIQDSTPIIERFEAGQPSLAPEDPRRCSDAPLRHMSKFEHSAERPPIGHTASLAPGGRTEGTIASAWYLGRCTARCRFDNKQRINGIGASTAAQRL
jgi:glutathione S-transferase